MGELTDDEIMLVNGRRQTLTGKIQEKYGITVEEANMRIDEWAAKLRG
jgi:uncharacterized protein YjbJ (UPF0337 family)